MTRFFPAPGPAKAAGPMHLKRGPRRSAADVSRHGRSRASRGILACRCLRSSPAAGGILRYEDDDSTIRPFRRRACPRQPTGCRERRPSGAIPRRRIDVAGSIDPIGYTQVWREHAEDDPLAALAAVLAVAAAAAICRSRRRRARPRPPPRLPPPPAAPAHAPRRPRPLPKAAKTTEVVDNPYGLEALWKGGDMVAKVTLAILVIMSMGSWYIIITKVYEQTKMGAQARAAEKKFWKAPSVQAGRRPR